MIKKSTTKLAALFVTLCMALTLVPFAAFAEDGRAIENGELKVENEGDGENEEPSSSEGSSPEESEPEESTGPSTSARVEAPGESDASGPTGEDDPAVLTTEILQPFASGVEYIDENGEPRTQAITIDIESATTTWDAGWYSVSGDVNINQRVEVTGTVNLILIDGNTLTVDGGIHVTGDNTLNIYGQSGNIGKLIADATDVVFVAGIGGNDRESGGNITINGGKVEATGGNGGAGIGGGTGVDVGGTGVDVGGNGGMININGGTVSATGGINGAGVGGGADGDGGNITISGGELTAHGGSRGGAGIGGGTNAAGGTILIDGGTVKATGGDGVPAMSFGGGAGIGSGGGAHYVGNSSDSGSVTITGDVMEVTAQGGAGASGPPAAHAGAGVGTGGAANDGDVGSASGVNIDEDANVNATGGAGDGDANPGAKVGTGGSNAGPGVELFPPSVPYLDENGEQKICDIYTLLTAEYLSNNGSTLSGGVTDGWFVVDSSFDYANRIEVSGDVHLILADGCALNASAGITVEEGNGLTIYAHSKGDGMGALTATVTVLANSYAAIGGAVTGGYSGAITVTGGTVMATGGKYGAGIGGSADGSSRGAITITGGTVTATGGEFGAGIGGGAGGGADNITINGGTVTATSSRDAGIGGSGGVTLSMDGNAVVVASSVNDTSAKDNGVLFIGGTGTMYGDVTVETDAEFPPNSTLTVGSGQTLSVGTDTKLTNSGTFTIAEGGAFTVDGAFINDGTVNNYGVITGWNDDDDGTLNNVSETGVRISSQSGEPTTETAYRDAITITATAEVKEGSVALRRAAGPGYVDFYLEEGEE